MGFDACRITGFGCDQRTQKCFRLLKDTCWLGVQLLVLNKGVDARKLYDLAIRQSISIAPGRMFTLQDQFGSCMRLCIGLP